MTDLILFFGLLLFVLTFVVGLLVQRRATPVRRARGGKQEAKKRMLETRTADFPSKTMSDTTPAVSGRQTLILDNFPSVADVKILGPNSGTANRYALSKARKRVHARVWAAVLRQGIYRVAPPVHVTLRYVMPDEKHRDADNFAAIGKPVIDGLVKAQILAGDNAARLTQRIEFVKERGARRLEVLLEPLGPAPAREEGARDDG
jgi:hypothetical protein